MCVPFQPQTLLMVMHMEGGELCRLSCAAAPSERLQIADSSDFVSSLMALISFSLDTAAAPQKFISYASTLAKYILLLPGVRRLL